MANPYDQPYGAPRSGLAKFLGVLNASFRLGRFFDVEVRVYWLSLIIVPILAFTGHSGQSAGSRWLIAVLVMVLINVVIWSHEMGHIFMGRRFGVHTPLITLSPMGGVAHMSGPMPSPRAEILVSLAGPATHLVWLALVAPLWFLLFDGHYFVLSDTGGFGINYLAFCLWFLYMTNIWLMAFNLLPFFPMDGGRTLRAALALRMTPGRATRIATTIGIGGAIVIGIASFFWAGLYGTILFLIAISNLLACLQERVAMRWSTPYGAVAVRRAWESDPDAWQHGGSERPAKAASSGPTRKQRRAEARAQRAAEEARNLEQEVDRILAKVSEVGMTGLTTKEKNTLQRASEARRKGRP